MPKRTRAGLQITTAPGRIVRRTFRKRVVRRRYGRGKRGMTLPNYSFHRWMVAFSDSSSLVNVTNCTYDLVDSILTATAASKTCALSLGFQLNDIPNVSEFTTLFDSYMITGVMLQIKMINNPDSNNSTNNDPANSGQLANFFPTIWYVADHDDNANMSLAAIKEFAHVRHKVLRPNSETNIMLRPTTLTQVYRTALTSGYVENRKRQWIDIANPNVPHYGSKLVFDFEGLAPAATYKFKINAKYFFKCKNVR